jgi:hypothetical protein
MMQRVKVLRLIAICVTLAASVFNINTKIEANEPRKDIKVLVLIVTSDDLPVYTELQNIWRSYMHRDHEHVEAYFIRGNPNLAHEYEIEEEIIWSRCQESLIPGILTKTIMSLEAMLPRIKSEFDYVLRTNLSSFYVFPRLLEFLKQCPRTNFYGGSPIGKHDLYIGSGSGFLMSPDIAELLVKNKQYFINNASTYDDVIIGNLLKCRGIWLQTHPRMDCYTMKDWYGQKDNIPDTMFHFRIKNPEQLRLKDDVYIQSQLLDIFYQ